MSQDLEPTPPPRLGPAMAKLNDRQRRFVMLLMGQATPNYTQAYRNAGYANNDDHSTRVAASMMAHNPRILAAIKEEAANRMNASLGMAAEVLVEIAGDPTHKDRLKAAAALLNRGGLHERTEVIKTHDVSDNAAALMTRMSILAQGMGLDPKKLLGQAGIKLVENDVVPDPNIIEAEFTEFDPAPVKEDWE